MQAEIDAGNFLEACQVQHGAEAHLYGSSLVTVRGVASTGETNGGLMLAWASAVYISPACRLWRSVLQQAATLQAQAGRSAHADMLCRTGGSSSLPRPS